MPDREKRRPTTSEEWSDYISEFAHKWEVGSVEHSAINDYHNLQRLYKGISKEPNRKEIFVTGDESLTPVQRQELILQRIGLLEHAIEQKSGSMPGYGSAYTEISTSFGDLTRAASQEAKGKYQDQEKQIEYIKRIYDETLDDVYSSIFERQNPNIWNSTS